MQYGFDHLMVRVSSKEELNKHVSDEQIYHHYLGDFVVDEYMPSPRGEEDPSFKIDFYDGQLQWRDFGYDHRPGDAVNLVQFLEDIQGRSMNYYSAMQKILAEVSGNVPYTLDVTMIQKEKAELRVRYRHNFTYFEQQYWKGERLRKSTIKHFKVFPGEIWHDNKCWHHSRNGDPLFIYLWDIERSIWKGYRPHAPCDRMGKRLSRFVECNSKDIIQGWEFLSDATTCIITKSYKDVMSYFDIGYVSIAPQSENQFLSPEQVKYIKGRYPNVYINYDPDDAGLRNMKLYGEQFDLPFFHFGNEGVKDLTELRKKKEDRYVSKCLTHLLHQ